MRKTKFLLPFMGTFLMCLAGCENENGPIIITKCDHTYVYNVVDGIYHNEVCEKCGDIKFNSRAEHDIDSATGACKICSYVQNKPGECTEHTWGETEILVSATCTESGATQRTCTVCGKKEDPKVIKPLNHDFVEDISMTIPAKCTENGVKYEVCTRCGTRKEVVIDALGHEWKNDAIVEVAPTCTTNGKVENECERCGYKYVEEIPAYNHNWVLDDRYESTATCEQDGVAFYRCTICETTKIVEVPALGHDYSDWTPVEGSEPTCEKEGYVKHTCSRCYKVETDLIPALGHHLELVGYNPNPDSEETTIRVYKCTNKGCWETYLGFEASDVTSESKSHLVINNDGGVKFWGRPIGNALALDENGNSINQEYDDVVYCTSELGDYMEYSIYLTEEQAALLSTCKLYCDAQPADYLNGEDFWAYGKFNDDWTPGYYIDGVMNHIEHKADGTDKRVKDHDRAIGTDEGVELDTYVPMGKRVENYRYVLYVDDKIQEFNPFIKVPTVGNGTNMVRKEYVMPYLFHLHPGLNKIRLHMAGGYRSTFYNFVFRPYEEHSFTLNVNDVTDASRATLNFTQSEANGDIGACYKGRPIGNALALDVSQTPYTSIHQEYNEVVYSRSELGDYYEFVFNLTAEEARYYSECMCYCDALPSQYIGYDRNKYDFWRYGRATDDWTCGFYIDNDNINHVELNEDGTYKMVNDHAKAVGNNEGVELSTQVPMGKRVEEFRYVLYVDGVAQDFDSNIIVPIENVNWYTTVRKEYVMPFVFNLHEGENRISLHMAGNYISTFYNFTFRPCNWF